MAAQAAPTPNTGIIDVGEQLKRKFAVGPRNWDAFQAAAGVPDSKLSAPPSGAHVTLEDLSRDPSTILVIPSDDPDARAAIEDDGGWVGFPDPTKYAPDTTHLSPKELKEEIEKGNVMLWKDFKKEIGELTGEDRETLEALASQAVMKHRRFVTLSDGSKVSLWDLHQYVENNPELAALYRSGRIIPTADPNDPAGRSAEAGALPPEQRCAGLPMAVVSPDEVKEMGLFWRCMGSGSIWRRRPTRWLGGLDGLQDWRVAAYAHEPMVNVVLGPKYGGVRPSDVLQDPSYAHDVLRCGSLMGMTFILTAARDMQLREVASSIRDQLAARLQRQAPLSVPRRIRPTIVDPTDLNGATWVQALESEVQEGPTASGQQQQLQSAEAGCDEMGVCWRRMGEEEHRASVRQALSLLEALPEELCPAATPNADWPLTGTRLVDEATGSRTWRQGGALWLTLEPEGGVVLQATSAGTLGEQESYWLTRLEGQEALAGAVMDAFLGPRPVDPEMAANVRSELVLPLNGFAATDWNGKGDPHNLYGDSLPYPAKPLPAVPVSPSAFRLAPRAEIKHHLQPVQGGTVLAGIRESRAAEELQDLLIRASAAAADAAAKDAAKSPPPVADAAGPAASLSSASMTASARDAAAKVLQEGVESLGPVARRLLHEATVAYESPVSNELRPEVLEALREFDRAQPSGPLPREVVVSDLFSLARKLNVGDGEA